MKMYVLDNGSQILDKSFLVAGCNVATTDNKNPQAIWQEQPDAPWMKGKRFTKSIGVDEAVRLGEGKSAEAMLDGYISDEQLATFFL